MYWQRQGQPQKALDAFQMAVNLEPETSAWRMALGGAYERAGNLPQAAAEYQRAVELDPQDTSGWRTLALFSVTNGYDLTGTGSLAVQNLLKLAPKDWRSQDIAGQLAFSLGKIGEAQHKFEEAIMLVPGQPEPHLHLALVYLELGQRAAAHDELETARGLDPDGPAGWQAGHLLEQYFP
jgi:Flp pilus assembly protein TadD